MQRWIMHIDMDAFFTSVEQHDNPSLKGLPVIVGGSGMRGVVSAASYEARTFGVKSAMPIFRAKRLCPNGIFLRGRMARYAEVSHAIMGILHGFSPVVEKASIDEAYLDASGLTRVFGPVKNMAMELKQAVFGGTGLTCSVGLAPVKFLAKIASDMDKPNGLTIVPPESVRALLARLPVAKIPGVGEKTLPTLHGLGVSMASDVARYPKEFWLRRLGKMGGVLFDRANGVDEREILPFELPKSESAENTFEVDTLERDVLVTWLLRQSERVGRSLRKQGLMGRTVTLKVKYADFTGVTRAKTLVQATNITRVFFDTAVSLLEELQPKEKLRLIGIGVSHFDDGAEKNTVPHVQQLSLLEATPAREGNNTPVLNLPHQAALDAAMDAVCDKFGINMVMRGRLLEQERKAEKDRTNRNMPPKER